MGKKFYGGFGYADDLKLLCPSITGLQKMITICEEFGKEYDVSFNAKKTMCICYGPANPENLRNVYLNDVPITWSKSVKYLGIILTHDLSDSADIDKKKGDFISAVNKFNAVFKSVSAEVKASLLQTYCTSWYGCQTWQLGTPIASAMDVQWRKAVRRTMGLPVRTRSVLLPGLAGNPTFSHQHQKRVTRLLDVMAASQNEAVQYIFAKASQNSSGPLGKNRIYARNLCSADSARGGHEADNEIHARSAQIRELLRVRDGLDRQHVLDFDEVREIFEYVCTY